MCYHELYVYMHRPVTVPFQFKEMELFDKFSFMRTGDVDQFLSSELEMFTSSFELIEGI